ncbi:hypothetical protein [Couchioplanes caeruleus]|uniref:hypothetical protein n=1 Tax=Couchioplanes caeruleus TaxID=56438 RepID=UPI001474D8ED|nr:hypothetical protein [Couchioplanes caeruleus]
MDRHDPVQGDGIDVSLDVETSVITLAVHGTWGHRLQNAAHAAIHKSLTGHPAALILDL